MQRVPALDRQRLPRLEPPPAVQLGNRTLDPVDPLEALEAFPPHRAVQLLKLPARVSRASCLRAHAQLHHRLVGLVVVADDRSVPALEELHRVLRTATRA